MTDEIKINYDKSENTDFDNINISESENIENVSTDFDKIKIIRNKKGIIKILKKHDWDDKDLVILSVTIIGIFAIIFLTDPVTIVSSIISGLFGLATGRALKNKF